MYELFFVTIAFSASPNLLFLNRLPRFYLLFLSFSEFWSLSCPRYQLNALFAMAHSTSFGQFKHSLGIGAPLGSFSKNPSIVHSELFSLITLIDLSVFLGFCPFSFGDIVKKKARSKRRNKAIINRVTNCDSRNWNMLLSLWRTTSTLDSKKVRLIALTKSTSLRRICILR